MRIQVNANGQVEFSVHLNASVDPSLVATMVAAVRRGIVTPSQKPAATRPDPSEPNSDPDPHVDRQDRPHERVPSPLIQAPVPKLSVRQLAAEIESRPDIPYTQYDPVREFSSSPATWIPSKSPFVDPLDPLPYGLREPRPTVSQDYDRSRRLTIQRHSPVQTPAPPPSTDVRMLSLPSSSRYDNQNNPNNFQTNDIERERVEQFQTRRRSHSDGASASRPTASSDALPEISDRHVRPDRPDSRAGASSAGPSSQTPPPLSQLTEAPYMEHDRSIAPSSPYVQHEHEEAREEGVNDAWDNVEYVLTESYGKGAKSSDVEVREDSNGRPYTRSVAWRLLSTIGTTFGRRRPEPAPDEMHESTLAPTMGYPNGKLPPPTMLARRNKGLFSRNNVRNGSLWLEFSSPLGVERMLAEVGKISKCMGYQVWRRPGENKLRCIRRLSHRQEMHMVILVGSLRLPEGNLSVVRMRRARGDRNRTETWRYAHFYRELMERLERCGVQLSAE